MKKVLLAVLAVALMAGVAFAEVDTKNIKIMGTEIPGITYDDEYYKERNAIDAGVGIDLLLFKWEEANYLSNVKLELKKDFVDIERFSGYLVLEVDVSSVLNFLKK